MSCLALSEGFCEGLTSKAFATARQSAVPNADHASGRPQAFRLTRSASATFGGTNGYCNCKSFALASETMLKQRLLAFALLATLAVPLDAHAADANFTLTI